MEKIPAAADGKPLIDELLSRSVESVIPLQLAKQKLASGERLRLYFGVDPTGARLHVGHAVVLRKLQRFAEAGHEVVFLIGSFTAMIGDPSGRDRMREPLLKSEVEQNFKEYKSQAEKILDFSKVEVRYNDEWLAPLTFSKLVELAGNFTVQQMLKRDMFEKRLQEGRPIGLHEFLYPLMVAYDSVMLDVDGELGGSDQEFNMLAGRHLQTALGKKDKFVLTTRLIEGLDGRKMSKTYDNCIYLNDEPFDMYGKAMSLKDELLGTYFECATTLPMAEVQTLMAALAAGEVHPKEAKMRLAREIVTLYHDKDAAQEAENSWVGAFSEGAVPEDAPSVELPRGTLLRDALKDIVSSTSELRRLVSQGAVSEVGGRAFESIDAPLEKNMALRVGKHRFIRIIVK